MSVLASKTPRDLNHDPEPWRIWTGPWVNTRTTAAVPGMSERDPRPEFDHVQHHEPNPILVAVRASALPVEEWHVAVFATEIYGGLRAWDADGHPFLVLTKASDEQLDHAERVLGRLVGARGAAL